MRHRVQLQSPTEIGRTDVGEQILRWDTYADISAAKRDISFDEFLASQQLADRVDVEFLIHFRSDVRTAHRAVCEGTIYNLRSVLDLDGDRRSLQLLGYNVGTVDG